VGTFLFVPNQKSLREQPGEKKHPPGFLSYVDTRDSIGAPRNPNLQKPNILQHPKSTKSLPSRKEKKTSKTRSKSPAGLV
jgi:hypothetical protein